MYRAVVTKKIASVGFVLIALFGSAVFVFATPPSTPYNPAETLNPSCAPGDTNCYVTLGSGGATATNGLEIISSSVGWGGDLTQDTTITGDANTYSLDMNSFSSINFAADRDFFIRSNDRVRVVQGGNYIQVGGGQGVDLTADANKSIAFNFNGTNSDLQINSSAGTAGQVLTSNGTGVAPSWTTISGGSGWGLTGNSGTTAGTNFIGTTDAEDFIIKVDGTTIARFGQDDNIAFGSSSVASGISSFATFGSTASGFDSFAVGGATASGSRSVAIGSGSLASGASAVALGDDNHATGDESTAFGFSTTASGVAAVSFGTQTLASGDYATAFGHTTFARAYRETAIGSFNVDYTPVDPLAWDSADRLLVVGNGTGSGVEHNAYTLWKDGSFAYNDDNFENNNLGTEQNMFYFNYGNHNGKGTAQTKHAIRLGSAANDEWDIGSANVGNRSIALGFDNAGLGYDTGIASGANSVAIGSGIASGVMSFVLNGISNSEASGIGSMVLTAENSFASGANAVVLNGLDNNSTAQQSVVWGNTNDATASFATAWGNDNTASGQSATVFGTTSVASGDISTAFGAGAHAYSFAEVALGVGNTSYTPALAGTTTFNAADRLLVVGNANGSASDAFTILKNGNIGIGINNWEANADAAAVRLKVSGSGTVAKFIDGAASCSISPTTAGNVTCSSDIRLKKNIESLNTATILDQINRLDPVVYNWKTQPDGTQKVDGFIAQDVQGIFPDLVTTNSDGMLSLSYIGIVPYAVAAIQELDMKISDIESFSTVTSTSFKDRLIAWLGDAANGITSIVTGRLQTNELCVEDVCVTKDQFLRMVQTSGSTPTVIPGEPAPAPTPDTVPTADTPTPEAPVDEIAPEPVVPEVPVLITE